MSEHVRSSAEIEREIEEERGALARSLEALQDSLLPENLISSAAESIKDNGGDIVRSVSRTARDNPVAVAVAGAGLTMLIAGIGAKTLYDKHSDDDQGPQPRVGYAAPSKGTSPGLRENADGSFDDRVAAADEEIRYRDYAERRQPKDRRGVWAKASHRARRAYGSLTENLTSTDMRERIAEGTEKMSEAARERVMRARAKAISAQMQLETKAKKGGDDLMNFAKDEPLIAGAIVFLAGAALGALLPRSSVENEYLGEHRDRLLSRADDIFREETAKLRAVAEAAVAEGRAVAEERIQAVYDTADEAIDQTASNAEDVLDRAKDSYKAAEAKVEKSIADAKEKTPTGKDAVKAVENEVRTAANRVTEAAKDEAKRQDLGGSV